MRSIDWSQTPLGPVEGWPQSLRSLLSLLLTSPSPVFLWWGREFLLGTCAPALTLNMASIPPIRWLHCTWSFMAVMEVTRRPHPV
ncbi:hypothetical protein F0U60_51465 [Archangium minus]|uniref:Uncharacterized protein n=1 Tax=Archangium minus TaxID=83450 RepID=A0ABY9X898_9BACT|nr:hypothetical protein F0U60_51465 [Archangium minus]